jgi:hypothetical protein
MADSQSRLTGRASYFQFSGTKVPIKKYSASTTRTLVDTTDTGDYNVTADMLYETQIPAKIAQDLDVEGNFRLNQTNSLLMSVLFSGASSVAVVLGLDAGDIYGHGSYDISDFSTEVGVGDVVSYTCKMKLNGVFTPGS